MKPMNSSTSNTSRLISTGIFELAAHNDAQDEACAVVQVQLLGAET